ncbi:MAG: hypothetical protein KKE39_04650 [Bacteroidetes bacterium]|nr:hypothetical protein [Bacteroidota bacterium]MBU1373733.1 hypothetical protein [Bacteroidota bacterium]MBU1486107.1 hypothetical protein [Bacteroidota bacterium]MBU1760609.1 hypothetical protein [Bacteroidota bacterium]MBU2046696.1 hypothetical protein [Bacteroidota bacterium]
MERLIIKRNKQFFAFNQIVTLTINDEHVFRLGNGEEVEIDVDEKPLKIIAESCFGNDNLLIHENHLKENKIFIRFKKTNKELLFTVSLRLILTSILIYVNFMYDLNFTVLILMLPLFFILKNKEQLELKTL